MAFNWPEYNRVTGISFCLKGAKMSEIRDGSSNTILAGEKYIPQHTVWSGRHPGDDQFVYVGDDCDIRRFTSNAPAADSGAGEKDDFGSSHSAGANFAFCDGSVRLVTYDIDVRTFRSLGNRSDERPLK
jgi:prepilin-type processing-associated H-X9-DG protein